MKATLTLAALALLASAVACERRHEPAVQTTPPANPPSEVAGTTETTGAQTNPPSEVTGTTETTGAETNPPANPPSDVGTTETTGAPMNRDSTVKDNVKDGMEAAKDGGGHVSEKAKEATTPAAAPATPSTEDMDKYCADKEAKAKADKAAQYKKQKAAQDKAAKKKAADEAAAAEKESKMEEEKSSTTTITSGEIMPAPTPAPAPPPAPAPEVNRSTTLGDGSSGEYTGGYGTYGGKATWGTGGPKR